MKNVKSINAYIRQRNGKEYNFVIITLEDGTTAIVNEGLVKYALEHKKLIEK